jgi:transcriptional regulator with XRE-family HTH domain
MTPKLLRQNRKRLGLTQPALAKLARVSVTTISRAERGFPVESGTLAALEKALGKAARKRRGLIDSLARE